MRKAREYKALARQRMFRKFGTLAGATAIYGGLYVFIILAVAVAYVMNLLTKGIFTSMASVEQYMTGLSNDYGFFFISELIIMLIGAIMSTLAVAIQYMCLKTARGQEAKISDLFYVVKNNPDKVIVIYIIQQLLMFLFGLPANLMSFMIDGQENMLLEVIYFVLVVLSYIADIVVIAMFSQAMFLYIDDPMEGAIRCIELSNHVMKKHMGRYISLILSFIPLLILATFSFGVLYLWVIPYMHTSTALFYMQLKGELGSTIDVTIE